MFGNRHASPAPGSKAVNQMRAMLLPDKFIYALQKERLVGGNH
jgi:hypothetical protein